MHGEPSHEHFSPWPQRDPADAALTTGQMTAQVLPAEIHRGLSVARTNCEEELH